MDSSRNRRKAAAATLSVVSNTVLVLLKLAVGLTIGSVAVLSEAIHSAVDLLAAGIALFAVRRASEPADVEHPFGHGKYENVSGVVEALLIFVAAGWIVYEALQKLLHPHPMDGASWGVAVMLVSAAANWLVSAMLFRVGRATDSIALQADGWHLRTDIYTSIGVMVGLGGVWLGQRLAPGLSVGWLDPVAALVVALLILKAAWELTRDAGRDLIDTRLPAEEEAWVREYLSGLVPAVRGFYKLRTRKAGSERFVEVRLLVRPDMSVDEGYAIAERIGDAMRARFAQVSVTVQLMPCRCTGGNDCPHECRLNEAVPTSIAGRPS